MQGAFFLNFFYQAGSISPKTTAGITDGLPPVFSSLACTASESARSYAHASAMCMRKRLEIRSGPLGSKTGWLEDFGSSEARFELDRHIPPSQSTVLDATDNGSAISAAARLHGPRVISRHKRPMRRSTMAHRNTTVVPTHVFSLAPMSSTPTVPDRAMIPPHVTTSIHIFFVCN